MVHSSISVPCQGTHKTLGPRVIGLSGMATSYPYREVHCWRDDTLPSMKSGSDQLWVFASMREIYTGWEHQTSFWDYYWTNIWRVLIFKQSWGNVWGTGRYLHVSNCPSLASHEALVVKNSPSNVEDVRDTSSVPGWGRSPGEGHGNPLQYSCLKHSMDRGSWWTVVHRVSKSQTWLSDLAPTHTTVLHRVHIV